MTKGFFLTEALIAACLSAWLLTTLIILYLSQKHQNIYLNNISEVQENIRLTVNELSRDIRTAGYFACFSGNKRDILKSNFLTIYSGRKNRWYPNLPISLRNKVKTDTDILEIQKMETQQTDLLQTMISFNSLMVSKHQHFSPGEWIVVSNCQHAEIARLESVILNDSNQFLALKTSLNYLYEKNAIVSRLIRNRYYVRDTYRANQRGENLYGLYRQGIDGNTEELVSGIENFRIKPLGNVRARLKIALLFTSQKAVEEKPQSIIFDGKKYVDYDHYYHQAETLIVKSREKE